MLIIAAMFLLAFIQLGLSKIRKRIIIISLNKKNIYYKILCCVFFALYAISIILTVIPCVKSGDIFEQKNYTYFGSVYVTNKLVDFSELNTSVSNFLFYSYLIFALSMVGVVYTIAGMVKNYKKYIMLIIMACASVDSFIAFVLFVMGINKAGDALTVTLTFVPYVEIVLSIFEFIIAIVAFFVQSEKQLSNETLKSRKNEISMRYCLRCGAELERDAQYCSGCGAKISKSAVNK